MDLRIPNQIVLSFIKQEAGRLCFNQLIASLGNWHLASGQSTSQRPAAKLQTVTATQITQLYLLFSMFSLFLSQMKVSAGSAGYLQHICFSFTDVLGGMDEVEYICFILQKAMLKQPPRCSIKSQNHGNSKIWCWHKFLVCSHCISVVNLQRGATPAKMWPFPL